MSNTQLIEDKYGKPIKEWDISDFNVIGQTKPEIADLLDVATCRENAQREDLPVSVKKIFMGYVLIIAFKDANEVVENLLQEWSKKYERDESPVTKILNELNNLFIDKNISDYIRLRAVNTMLAYWSAQDDAKSRCELNKNKDDIVRLIEGLLEDLEFLGVRTFILYSVQYIDLMYSTGSFYHSVYGEDILVPLASRTKLIDEEFTAITKEMETIISSDPTLMKQFENMNPEDLGMPNIFDSEDNNEQNGKSDKSL